MTLPSTTTWNIEPHTLAKHVILKAYLAAWFPILSSWSKKVVYVDGFAGPGLYKGGEFGSPIIALNAAVNHATKQQGEFVLIFVEKDPSRYQHLAEILEQRKKALPGNITIRPIQREFAPYWEQIIDDLNANRRKMPPCFAFIDPFGVTEIPFRVVEKHMAHKKAEVFITFMDSTIRRFVSQMPGQINDLIGNPKAAAILQETRGTDRIAKARKLYAASLKKCAKFVWFFEMRNKKNEVIYDLFFATNHSKGLSVMKAAMWKADEAQGFAFSDGINPKMGVLFSDDPQDKLSKHLARHFSGRVINTEKIIQYTEDETPYLSTHAREAMKLLENTGKIEVDSKKGNGATRRKGSFPEGVVVRFPKTV